MYSLSKPLKTLFCFYSYSHLILLKLFETTTNPFFLNHKKKLKFYKKYIVNYENIKNYENMKSAIVTPDKDIVDNPNLFSPAYVVFDNYELILKWNRSLRFALAVCTLKSKFKNEI